MLPTFHIGWLSRRVSAPAGAMKKIESSALQISKHQHPAVDLYGFADQITCAIGS